MSRPRVLLVEDDPSLRRFVSMALEDMDIELVSCASVAAALSQMRQGPFCLVLTDLMLPGESGFDLMAHARREPALLGAAKLAVLSAGLTPAVRAQLEDASVWRLLSKPVSVAVLVACVEDAIADAESAAAALESPGTATALPSSLGDQAHAVREYFGGSQELFDVYRRSCIGEFRNDLRLGDAALAAADAQALRRLAHSLKSVLLMRGHPPLSALARRLEESSQAGLPGAAAGQWAELRAALVQFLHDAPPHKV